MTAGRRLPPDQRRAQIVQAAIDAVAARGFAAASLEVIAARAGVSKGLVVHYASSRDALMAEAARTALVQLRSQVAQGLDAEADAVTFLRAAIRGAARLARTHERELAALEQIVAGLRDEDGGPVLGIADMEETFEGQEGVFARGQRDGVIRAGADLRTLALVYEGAVEAMVSHLRAHPEADTDAFAEGVADVLLTGIAARS
ncbi:TetR/AcrR family transcriptional regulator [Brachybacterium sp. ACRRE]|uniref:TetR family transcriptional regulator n=1 Tax=Brachybacterium sp. ACRRE TaxID=2918184 RepID=UPI001EF2DCC5|nr:TetR family transcriptional regulator [Brachybacterium sp. ACRRE]